MRIDKRVLDNLPEWMASRDDIPGGWIMANLYPFRATKSDELPEKADPKLLENNMKVLRAVMKSYVIGAAWAAWGNSIDSRFYLGESLCRIEEEQIGDFEWFYRGKMTNDGNPRHPLYMKAGEKFEWFPVFDYAGYWRYPDLY